MNDSRNIISDQLLDTYLHAVALIAAGKRIPPVPDGRAQEEILAKFYERLYELPATCTSDLIERIQSWAQEKLKEEKDKDAATFSILEDVILARPPKKYVQKHPGYVVDDPRILIEYPPEVEAKLIGIIRSYKDKLSPGQRYNIDWLVEQITG